MPRYIVIGTNKDFPNGFLVSHFGDDPEIYTNKSQAEPCVEWAKEVSYGVATYEIIEIPDASPVTTMEPNPS